MNTLAYTAVQAALRRRLSNGVARSFASRAAERRLAHLPAPAIAAAMHRIAWQASRSLRSALLDSEVQS